MEKHVLKCTKCGALFIDTNLDRTGETKDISNLNISTLVMIRENNGSYSRACKKCNTSSFLVEY